MHAATNCLQLSSEITADDNRLSTFSAVDIDIWTLAIPGHELAARKVPGSMWGQYA